MTLKNNCYSGFKRELLGSSRVGQGVVYIQVRKVRTYQDPELFSKMPDFIQTFSRKGRSYFM